MNPSGLSNTMLGSREPSTKTSSRVYKSPLALAVPSVEVMENRVILQFVTATLQVLRVFSKGKTANSCQFVPACPFTV